MKKFASLLMALVMALTLAVPVVAADGNEEKGSITISGVSETTTYEIYKILDLESYSKEDASGNTEGTEDEEDENGNKKGAYSYTIAEGWGDFFKDENILKYVKVENGYVTWIASDDEDTVAKFAKEALAYAKAKPIQPTKTSKNSNEFVIDGTTGTFSDLDLGYYLVDSTMGALCGLTTTNPDAHIRAKNGQPTIDKQVMEDSTNQWGKENSADIGQIVQFRTTINVHKGAENYILHDTMDAGLTFKQIDKIEHIIPGKETHNMSEEGNYTIKYNTTNCHGFCDSDETSHKTCTFEIHFTKELCDKLETNDKIVVYYSAVVNENASIGNVGDKNTSMLEFGEDNFTEKSITETFTYAVDIVKTNSTYTLIDGAKFKLYVEEPGGNKPVAVLYDDQNGKYLVDADGTTYEEIIVKNGNVRLEGLDNGTYYLEETEAPDGYNKLTGLHKFIVADANLDVELTDNDTKATINTGVIVVNKTGTILPSTGGMGTTLFYALGGLLVIGAGVALVTKKRMG